MKNIYCVFCGKYRKFKHPKMSCIFKKTLVLSTICSKYENKGEKNLRRRINRYFWFNQKNVSTLKKWLKKR